MANHSESHKTLRALIIMTGLIVLGVFLSRQMERNVLGASSSISQGLDKVLGALTNSNTRIVEGRAEIVEQNEISELSLLELKMTATRSFENENYVLKYLPAGTKQLIVRGDYRITAGYKLKPGVSLAVEKGIPVARFPEAEILGVELIEFNILSEKDGWANSITAEDRATLLRELRQQMRMEAEKSGVLDVVDAALRTRMKDLIGSDHVRIEHEEMPTKATP